MSDKHKINGKKYGDFANESGMGIKEKTILSEELYGLDNKRNFGSHNISSQQWNDWHWHVRNQITTVAELEKWFPLTVEEKRAVQFSQERFHFSLTPYWASLMDENNFLCPIRRQAIPVDEEFRTSIYESSEFGSQPITLANGRFVHARPDRAVLFVQSRCIVYCRFCPKRKIPEQQGSSGKDLLFYPTHEFTTMTQQDWKETTQYLKNHPEIQEVIITGGEPLLLRDELLADIFARLKAFPSIKTLRLETRIISVLPQRITPSLIRILKDCQPIYLILHVNHPYEITPEFSNACSELVDSGIPLASETVLLHEINDKPNILSDLFSALFELRVRPYRLVQCVPSQGTDHFRTTISAGLKLVEFIRGRVAGLAVPEYVVDTAGGKISLRYESILSRNRKRVLLKNHEGKVFVYPEKNIPLFS